jgi:sodium/bile acid cotransporter 7
VGILLDLIRRYWFITGLLLVFALTIADSSETVSGVGIWFKIHRGPDVVIIIIFFFSGLILKARQIKSGLADIKGTLIALSIIFLIAPIISILWGILPFNTGVKIGFFLVAAMPTTLSSGVVMTGAAGGNMAHALVITVLANGFAVFTVPITLSLLLNLVGGTTVVAINKSAIMIKILLFVLSPLCIGLLIKFYAKSLIDRVDTKLQILNQFLVLGIVWMAISQAKQTIINSGEIIGIVFLSSLIFHGILLASGFLFTRFFRLGQGRMESVIFMGGQKTLVLSVILQVSLFPQYGLALVVCVMHHIVHLVMDGYLVGRLRSGSKADIVK